MTFPGLHSTASVFDSLHPPFRLNRSSTTTCNQTKNIILQILPDFLEKINYAQNKWVEVSSRP